MIQCVMKLSMKCSSHHDIIDEITEQINKPNGLASELTFNIQLGVL
jgi:hypothetical protein